MHVPLKSMAFNLVSFVRLKSFKAKTGVFAAIAVSLFGTIGFTGINLVRYLKAQDELLTSGLNRSERGLSQVDREVLRLAILVKASHVEFDPVAVQQQINVLKSRLGVIRKHHISSDLPPQLVGRLDELDQIWNRLQGDLENWLSDPKDETLQAKLYGELVEFEWLVNDLASKHTNQRRDQYVQLVNHRSGALLLIAVISLLFLIFIGFAVVITARFIRERQQILTAIEEKEKQYRRIIETSEEGIWLLDPQGKTTFANHRMATILGLEEVERGKTSLWDFLPSEADVEAACNYLAALRQGVRSPHDLKLLRRDGKVLWMLTNGAPIFDEMGEHTGTLCMLTDVTARKQSEEDLKIAKQKAEVANQAKSEFLANMSHELRTPLNGILGYAQILKRSEVLKEKERHGIQIIHQCGAHLLTLINDILDLSKIEARKLELEYKQIHLPSFLQGVVEICRVRADKKGIDFVYHPDADLPIGVLADEKRLRQVLINLLSNAIKFTDKGGVTLRVESIKQAGVTPKQPLASIRFQVKDTGVGISAADLEQIFRPFEQVGEKKRHAEGTGLGLAISHKIVRLMGNQIQVESQLGVGSTFSFEVSLTIADNWAQPLSSSHGQPIKGYEGSPRHLLVVDDRWENRSVLVDLLKPLGFKLTEAENGQEALIKARQTPFDLILTDIMMPVMNGFEMLKQLRNDDAIKQLTVIISSASVSDMDRQMSLEAGGDDFLPKPVDAEELMHLLAKHLQLIWIYDDSEADSTAVVSDEKDEPLVAPPAEDLQLLFELAQDGLLIKLAKTAEEIGQKSDRYLPFTQKISHLARQFETEKIEMLLQKYFHS